MTSFPVYISLLALLLFSCTQDPARVVLHDTASPAKTVHVYGNPYRASVQKSDTLYSIAKKNNVEVQEVIKTNNLRPPYTLTPGQTVKLPQAAFHIAGESDTLSAISHSYGVDINRLAKKNGLSPPYNITRGQKLFLPSKTGNDTLPALKEQVPVYGDSTTGIAERERGVVSGDIAPVTGRGSQDAAPFAVAESVPPVQDSAPFAYSSEKEFSESVTGKIPVQESMVFIERDPKQAGSKGKDGGPGFTGTSFIWPVSGGRIVSGFGPKKGGLYNDGVNIAASEGEPVRAAENGEVVYAGNELRGYGNMLLIKHNNGYLTAYAHTGDIGVKKGDLVKKGQVITHVGRTGHVSSPQLHFSIRQGRKAIDPEKHISNTLSS